MTFINQFDDKENEILTGEYGVEAVYNYWCDETRSNRLMLTLTDHTDRITVACLPDSKRDPALFFNALVKATISFERALGWPGAHVLQYKVVNAPDLSSPSALFNYEAVPEVAVDALDAFVDIVTKLQTASLKRFLLSVLREGDMQRGFLQSQGSRRHHHAYPGGLLVHTVSVMRNARNLAERVYPELLDLVELCVVFAFLHDLGKVVTQGPCSDPKYKGLTHDEVTPQLIQESLHLLRLEWPWAADRIEEMLNWFATRPAYERPWLTFKGADICHFADALDVMSERVSKDCSTLPREAANDACFGRPDEEDMEGWFPEGAMPEAAEDTERTGWFDGVPLRTTAENEAYIERINTAEFGPNWRSELFGYVWV